jgi:hypothetical protein
MGPVELGFLILTDHSEAVNGKIYVIGGGWNMLRFAELPTEHAFGISFGIDVPWDQTNQRHTLRLELQGPDGERLGDEFSFEFETGRPPGSVPGQDQRIVLSLNASIGFENPGPHAVLMHDGEQEIGRSRFYVLEMDAAA